MEQNYLIKAAAVLLTLSTCVFWKNQGKKDTLDTINTETEGGAIGCCGPGGGDIGCGYCQGFDLNNSVILTGRIEKIETIQPLRGMRQGVHILLKTEKETVSVHVGPRWYIESQDIRLSLKDNVTIEGIKTSWNNQPVVIAFKIEKGDHALILRDTDGRPVWAGWRRTYRQN